MIESVRDHKSGTKTMRGEFSESFESERRERERKMAYSFERSRVVLWKEKRRISDLDQNCS